jgi:hypothetical protein
VLNPLGRAVVATGGAASGRVAAVLHGFDGVEIRGPDVTVPPGLSNQRIGVRRRTLPASAVVLVSGFACTSALQTLCDLAAELDDLVWEQALESALRRRLTSIDELERAVPGTRGAARMRRVLVMRPCGAPPTESLLETLMVQLARTVPRLPTPDRQVEVCNESGEFVARVDLAWPGLGLFIELDGQHHPGQPDGPSTPDAWGPIALQRAQLASERVCQYSMTLRATSPVFMASKASLTWSRVMVREMSSSSLRSPFL